MTSFREFMNPSEMSPELKVIHPEKKQHCRFAASFLLLFRMTRPLAVAIDHLLEVIVMLRPVDYLLEIDFDLKSDE